MNTNVLEVKNLNVSVQGFRKKTPLVHDVTFAIPAGKTIAVVGESGSGKTLTALSILNLFTPGSRLSVSAKDILLSDESIYDLTEKEMQHVRGAKIGMIFQEPKLALHPSFKIGKQIQECLLRVVDMEKKDIRSFMESLLNKVGFENPSQVLDQYPHQLSGGMRQRVMIAMALTLDPELLIADEPTSSLDVLVQNEILELLKSLQRDFQLSMLFITHDFAVAEQIADLVMVMYAGRICEFGTMDQIFYNPLHPYTHKLLHSVPKVGMRLDDLDETHYFTEGGTKKSQGCSFANRCSRALEKCWEEIPPLCADEEDLYYQLACFNPSEPEGL